MTRRRYADVLESISKKGAGEYYTGWMAQATVRALQRANGTMVVEDLGKYDVIIRESLSASYRGFRLTTCGAPSSGTVSLQVMKILERYSDIGHADTIDTSVHRLDEAIRFGYGAVSSIYT